MPSFDAPSDVSHPRADDADDHIVVYGHSDLLYWWPVWLVSFALAGATYAEGDRSGGVTVSDTNAPGTVFVAVLLVVAVSSTVLVRGLMSVVAGGSVVTLAVLFAWFGWWDDIIGLLGRLEIRINGAGYLCVGVPLFVAWVGVVCGYDRMRYVAFGRGQIRYVLEVGDGEVAIPAEGAVVEKQRSDALRHWVLGLGAGDLVIRSAGHDRPAIELKNVLGIRRKLDVINRLLREKAVTVD